MGAVSSRLAAVFLGDSRESGSCEGLSTPVFPTGKFLTSRVYCRPGLPTAKVRLNRLHRLRRWVTLTTRPRPHIHSRKRFPMSLDRSRAAATRLADIDALQDDVLRKLDELERRTAAVLAQCLTAAPTAPAPAAYDLLPESAARRQAA